MGSTIQILLATYNGAAHLDAFFDSIEKQQFQDWSMLVRDDCSSDATREVLAQWRDRLGDRLQFLPDSGACNLGVVRSFSRLLNASTAPYVMFADQDDVWYPDKIAVSLAAMQQREALTSASSPILVHTDLALMDQDLQPIAPSYWKYQGIVPENGHALNSMMVENIAAGCTCIFNRPLIELVGEIPAGARYHDWWVSLVAAAFGHIVSLPIQTLAWRRHSSNSSDIISLSQAVWRALTRTPEAARTLSSLLAENRPQVQLFLERYHHRLTPSQVADVRAFLDLPTHGFLKRRISVLQHRLFFTSWQRTAGMLVLV